MSNYIDLKQRTLVLHRDKHLAWRWLDKSNERWYDQDDVNNIEQNARSEASRSSYEEGFKAGGAEHSGDAEDLLNFINRLLQEIPNEIIYQARRSDLQLHRSFSNYERLNNDR